MKGSGRAVPARACSPIPAARAPRRFPVGAACAAAVLGSVFGLHRIVNPDIFFQIVVGRAVLAHPTSLGVSTFLDTYPSFAYVEHEWLSSVLAALFDRAGGAGGLMVYQMLLTAAGAAAWFVLFEQVTCSRVAGLAGTALCLVASAIRLEPRPDLISRILFAVLLALLTSGMEPRRLMAIVPVLLALWVNVHAYFFQGLFLLGAALAASWSGDPTAAFSVARTGDPRALKRGLATFGLAAAACCLHPQGLKATLWPIAQAQALRDPLMRSTVGELSPLLRLLDGMGPVRWSLLGATIGISLLLPGTRWGGPGPRIVTVLSLATPWLLFPPDGLVPWPYRLTFVLGITGLIESVASIRRGRWFLPIVYGGALAMAVPLLRNLGFMPPVCLALCLPVWSLEASRSLERLGLGRLLVPVRAGIACGLIAFASWARLSDRLLPGGQYLAPGSTGWGVSDQRFPSGSMSFVQENGLPGPLLNDFDTGGYDLYRLYPDRRVFITGHMAWYPLDFLRRYSAEVMGGQDDPEVLFQRYGVRTAVLGLASLDTPNLIARLAGSPSWALVYLDRSGIVFLHREGLTDPFITRYGSSLAAAAEKVPPATPPLGALPQWLVPDVAGAGGLGLAVALRTSGQPALALRDASRIWEFEPTPDVAVFCAETADGLGLLDEQIHRLEKTQVLYPRSRQVARWLARALFFRADQRLVNHPAGLPSGAIEASRDDLRQSLRLVPDELGPLLSLAHLEASSGNLDEARRLLFEAGGRTSRDQVAGLARKDPLLAPLVP